MVSFERCFCRYLLQSSPLLWKTPGTVSTLIELKCEVKEARADVYKYKQKPHIQIPDWVSINHGDMEGGRGNNQLSIVQPVQLTKPYLAFKIVHKRGGSQKCLKNCPHGSWLAPPWGPVSKLSQYTNAKSKFILLKFSFDLDLIVIWSLNHIGGPYQYVLENKALARKGWTKSESAFFGRFYRKFCHNFASYNI